MINLINSSMMFYIINFTRQSDISVDVSFDDANTGKNMMTSAINLSKLSNSS